MCCKYELEGLSNTPNMNVLQTRFATFLHLPKVKGTYLEETRLRIYATISKAYPQKNTRSDEKLITYLTMFINVQYLLFTIPFCCGIPSTLNWDIISYSLPKESN